MKIHYDENDRVTGYTILGEAQEPFLDMGDRFVLEHDPDEYIVKDGKLKHVGKTKEKEDEIIKQQKEEKDDKEWNEYKKAEEKTNKELWTKQGKPKYK